MLSHFSVALVISGHLISVQRPRRLSIKNLTIYNFVFIISWGRYTSSALHCDHEAGPITATGDFPQGGLTQRVVTDACNYCN